MKPVKYSETMTPIASYNFSQNKICATCALVVEPRTTRKHKRSAHWQTNSTAEHVRPMARKPGHEHIIQRYILIKDKRQSLTKVVKTKTKMIKRMARTQRILQATSAARPAMSNHQDFQYRDTPASNTGPTSIT